MNKRFGMIVIMLTLNALGVSDLTAGLLPADQDQIILAKCYKGGKDLITKCINTPPLTKQQVERCSALKSSYITCLSLLNGNAPLEPSLAKDSFYIMPDLPNPFSPCIFRTGHLVMWDVCENE